MDDDTTGIKCNFRMAIMEMVKYSLIENKVPTKRNMEMEKSENQKTENVKKDNAIPKVTGVGGIFFFSDNPEECKEWYTKNLGIETNQWGSSFESRNVDNPEEINYLQWNPFKKGSEYFRPSKKEFMINYRVQNIEGLVEKLKNNGVTVVDDIETYDYGKFVHIMDPEGNKIELWEPVDNASTEIGDD